MVGSGSRKKCSGLGRNTAKRDVLDVLLRGVLPTMKTSSHKITEVKQLGPRLALGWVTFQGLDVDAVDKNIVKSRNPMLLW